MSISQARIISNQAAGTRNRFDWGEWALLTAAGILAGFAALPSIWPLVAQNAEKQGISVAASLAFQFVQSAVEVGILVAIGLYLAHRIGLGAPIIEAWRDGQPVVRRVRSILAPTISLGILTSVLVIALDHLVFAQLLPGFSTVITQIGGWQGVLASFEGGILEELELRLLVVSAVAWLLGKVSHTKQGLPSRGALWLAILVAAIVFGLGHMSATSLTVAITPLVVTRAIVLNGILGVLFGAMYCKRGLEAAMLCHFSADIVVHVLLPLIV